MTSEGKTAARRAKPRSEPAASRVVLNVSRADDGGVTVIPTVEGDVRLTEVATIIELGHSAWMTAKGLGTLNKGGV